MKVKREWRNETEVMDAVVQALETAETLQVIPRDEVGEYGDQGVIEIRVGDRLFQIDLHEIL